MSSLDNSLSRTAFETAQKRFGWTSYNHAKVAEEAWNAALSSRVEAKTLRDDLGYDWKAATHPAQAELDKLREANRVLVEACRPFLPGRILKCLGNSLGEIVISEDTARAITEALALASGEVGR